MPNTDLGGGYQGGLPEGGDIQAETCKNEPREMDGQQKNLFQGEATARWKQAGMQYVLENDGAQHGHHRKRQGLAGREAVR